MPISMFETRTMLAALEIMPPVKTFLRDTFFKTTKTFDTKQVDIDIKKGKRRVAVYVSPQDPGHLSEREGYTTSSYAPPYIKEKRGIEPADLLFLRNFGSNIYAPTSPQQRLAKMIADDLRELDEMITRAEELQASQALFEGEVTLRTGDAKVVFPVTNTHVIASMSNYWDDSTGRPLDDLRAWRKLIMKDSGVTPNIILCGSDAADALINNPQLAPNTGQISSVKIDRGQIRPEIMPSGATYIGFLRDVNCDVYSYDDWYADANGDLQPYVPVNKVFFGSTNARMDRLYGVIQDLQGMFPVARFAKSWEEEDPSMRFMELQSAPLMVPHELDSYVVATVINPSP